MFDFIKMNYFFAKDGDENKKTGKKSLQNTYLMKDLYPKHTENF